MNTFLWVDPFVLVALNDMAGLPCNSNTVQNFNATDYIRFAPVGGIDVTLGTITWGVLDSTHLDTTNDDYLPELVSFDVNPPIIFPTGTGHTDASPSDASTFPYWDHTLLNTY